MKYNIILADCPWHYSKINIRMYSGASYPTMSLQEIKDLPIQKIADKDCALFLWATYPKLPEAFEVIDAWNFKYITNAFTWIKLNPKAKNIFSGLGFWTNSNAEICLFAKKGKPKRKDKTIKQIVMANRGRHSAKPPEVRDRIVKLMGDLPRIELFAREQTEGWDAIGNEIDNKDIRVALREIYET